MPKKKKVVQGGERMRKKLSKKQSLTKIVESCMKSVQETRRDMAKMAFSTANELQGQHDRSQAVWELIWALIELLKETGIDLSEEALEKARTEVKERWHAEDLAKKKQELKPGQAICEKCFQLAKADVFAETGQCPRCESDEIYFHPEEEVVEEKKAS